MSDLTITCQMCGQPFLFEESERQWLLNRVQDGTLPAFVAPKRCKECRRKRQHDLRSRPPVPPKQVRPTGTDQCGCDIAPGAAYPACPHDLRGPNGEAGKPGVISCAPVVETEANRAKPGEVKAAEARMLAGPLVLARDRKPLPVPPPPASVPAADQRPVALPREEEMRVILCTADYEKLLCREEILIKEGNKKVRIILADIGFPAMKAALERAMLKWLKS